MKAASLFIYLQDNHVGHLVNRGPDFWSVEFAREGRPQPERCWSLSQLTSTANSEKNVRDWFRSLLPDAPSAGRLALRLGLSTGNDFALLGALARDAPGAVSLSPDGQPPATDTAGEPLSAPAMAQLLEQLLDGSAVMRPDGALWRADAGVLPVRAAHGAIALPRAGVLSDALLRAARHGLTDAVYNEAFCLRLAAAVGLPVVESRLEAGVGGTPYLLIQRPDRHRSSAEGPPGLVHMEAFVQLAGLAPEQNFEREGGLALLDCVGLIRRYSSIPALDLRALLRWVGFCCLSGNGLANGRDLHFLFTEQGPRLAPFVELVSSHIYPEMSERLGFYIGREDRPDWLLPARWRELAEELGVGHRYLLAMLKQLALDLPTAIEKVSGDWRKDRYWSPTLERIAALTARRARQLWVALEAEQV